jgi:hypothetical protein
VALLAQISAQLAVMANPSQLQNLNAQPLPSTKSFSPSPASLAVNAMWFLSLSLSLACALAAMLAQHWARNYTRSVDRYQQSPYKQGLIRALMFEGLEKSHIAEIVDLIPILIHISLFLFLAGLVVFLHGISLPIAYLVLSVFVICSTLYGVATIFPFLSPESALHTPLSSACYVPGVGRWMDAISKFQVQLATGSDRLKTPRTQDRVANAIGWTRGLANEPHEFEDFLIAIPDFALWQRPLLKHLIKRDDELLRAACRFLTTLIAPTEYDTAAQSSRLALCLEGVYCIISHRSHPWLDSERIPFILLLADYLSSCESKILSLVFCTVFASFTYRIPAYQDVPDAQFMDRDPSDVHAIKLAKRADLKLFKSDKFLLPLDVRHMRRSIDQMLQFRLGRSPQQALQNNFYSAPPDRIFQPFEFVIRNALPVIAHAGADVFLQGSKGRHARILVEAIWQAAEENNDQESFQQITFVHFLKNILSGYSFLEQDKGQTFLPSWLWSSVRSLLSGLLEATGSLDNAVASTEAIDLLTKYLRSNLNYGVEEAKTSLESLRMGSHPDTANSTNSGAPSISQAIDISSVPSLTGELKLAAQPHSSGMQVIPWRYDFHNDQLDRFSGVNG